MQIFNGLKKVLDSNFSRKDKKNYMKINTALILCAGYGKRLKPINFK